MSTAVGTGKLDAVAEYARELMGEHLDESWTFGFDNAVRRAGCCHYSDRRITMSRVQAANYDMDVVREVVLHEIAHALIGPGYGHGSRWRQVAISIGGSGERLLDEPTPTSCWRWLGVCPNGHRTFKSRLSRRHEKSCGRCSRTFDRRFLIQWQINPEWARA